MCQAVRSRRESNRQCFRSSPEERGAGSISSTSRAPRPAARNATGSGPVGFPPGKGGERGAVRHRRTKELSALRDALGVNRSKTNFRRRRRHRFGPSGRAESKMVLSRRESPEQGEAVLLPPPAKNRVEARTPARWQLLLLPG